MKKIDRLTMGAKLLRRNKIMLKGQLLTTIKNNKVN